MEITLTLNTCLLVFGNITMSLLFIFADRKMTPSLHNSDLKIHRCSGILRLVGLHLLPENSNNCSDENDNSTIHQRFGLVNPKQPKSIKVPTYQLLLSLVVWFAMLEHVSSHGISRGPQAQRSDHIDDMQLSNDGKPPDNGNWEKPLNSRHIFQVYTSKIR